MAVTIYYLYLMICFTISYSVLMIIIFIFELSLSIAGYVLRDKTSTYIEKTLYTKMNDYEKSDEISAMWDLIQEEFECCGVQSYSDWHGIFDNESLPISCCKISSGVVGAFYCNAFQQPVTTTEKPTTEQPITTETPPTDPQEQNAAYLDNKQDAVNLDQYDSGATYPVSTTKPYSSGCHSLFSAFIKKYAVNIGAVGISFAILQLGGIFVSFHLARQLRNSYYST